MGGSCGALPAAQAAIVYAGYEQQKYHREAILMKRLEDHMSSKAKKPAVRAFAKPGRDKVFVTETVHSKEAAINAKMRSVEPKLLGVKLVNYRQTGMRKVWVPCYFMIYDFNVKRNVFFNKSKVLDKSGTVGVVYDANEMHASHYDVMTDGEIPMEEMSLSAMEGNILPDGGSLEQILEDAEYSIRRQILFKAYKTMDSELTRVKLVKFYREAWELEMMYKDRTYTKYAYLDDYGVTNERARGLNTRLSM